MKKLNSSIEESDTKVENIIIDSEVRPKAKTRENWYREDAKSFSKISEEETISDRNSYGLRLAPKKVKRKFFKRMKKTDIKNLVSSFF